MVKAYVGNVPEHSATLIANIYSNYPQQENRCATGTLNSTISDSYEISS